MTEEALAAQLGLKETWRMKFARWRTLRTAPRSAASGSKKYVQALSKYEQLGEAKVDRKTDEDDARAKAQVALILLTASIKRDISRFNSSFAEYRIGDLEAALVFAWNMRFSREITDAIGQLIAA